MSLPPSASPVRRGRTRYLLAATFLSVAASGCGPDAGPVDLPLPEPAAILLDPTDGTLTSLSERIVLEGVVVDEAGDTLSGFEIGWASTDTAVVRSLGGGTFEAAGAGAADVVATIVDAPGVEARASIEVRQEVATAALAVDTLSFPAVGDTSTREVEAEDASGYAVDVFDVSWSTSDDSVARVAPAGVVEATGNGTATVTGLVTSGSDTVTVQAVVRVSQVVATVTLGPADSVALGPGFEVQYRADALDANGNPVADADFVWRSSAESVATVDPDGLVTTVGQGVTRIEAEAAGVVASTDLTVLTTGGYSRVWVGGAAAGPRDWLEQANWLPRLVPTLVDTVLVPATAVDQPRLSADWSVAGLVLEDGATLDLGGFTLTITEDLDGGSTIAGPGAVRLIGSGTSVRGSLPDLFVNGAVQLSGPLTVNGDLQVSDAGAGLVVGATEVRVTGDLRVQEGATLTMSDAGGLLEVDGQAVFDGASTLGLLTAGELRVGGNFTAWTSEPENFAPTLDHRTVLDGDVIQTVYLYHDDEGEARFRSLEIDNSGGVTLQSTIRVTDDLTVTRGSLSGNQTVHLGGDLDVLAAGGYAVLNTAFAGSPSLPASIETNVTFVSAFAVVGDLDIVGDLTVSGPGADLDVGPWRVTVSGNLTTTESGTLTSSDPGGVLDVAASAFFDGGPPLARLTAGELRVGGALTAWMAEPESFAPTGTHATVLDGTAPQSVYFFHNDPGEARFRTLTLDNAAGATLNETTRIAGDLVLLEGTLDGEQTVYVGGDLTEVLGGNQHRVLNTVFTGSPSLPASLQTNVTFAGAFTASAPLDVIGNVFVDGAGATLDVGTDTVTVSGDFRTANGGTLTMQNPSGLLDVAGEAEFNGGSTIGLLTDGELRLAGNFTAWTSDPENWAPTGAHRTTLDGGAAQTVYLYYSGASQGRFEDLVVENPTGVTFLGTTRVSDALTVSGVLNISLGQTALVAGAFTLEAGATLDNEGSLQANACTLAGTVTGNAPICP